MGYLCFINNQPINPNREMLPSALINFLPLIKIPALLPKILDFVEREFRFTIYDLRLTRPNVAFGTGGRLPIYDLVSSITDFGFPPRRTCLAECGQVRFISQEERWSQEHRTKNTEHVTLNTVSLSKYFAHSYWIIRPMQMLCLPVKDMPP